MCMRMMPTPRSATSAAISGSPRRAVTSLTIRAPTSTAAAATAAFEVSTEIVWPVAASPAITGSAPRPSLPPRPRARRRQLFPMRDRRVRVEVEAAVGERVGRHVNDPHEFHGGYRHVWLAAEVK